MAECGKGNCPARLSRNDRFSSERGERVTDGRDAGCRPSRSVSTMGRRTLSRGHGDGRARVTWNARGSLPLSGAARSGAGRDDAHSGNAAQSPATGERTADNKRGSGIAVHVAFIVKTGASLHGPVTITLFAPAFMCFCRYERPPLGRQVVATDSWGGGGRDGSEQVREGNSSRSRGKRVGTEIRRGL